MKASFLCIVVLTLLGINEETKVLKSTRQQPLNPTIQRQYDEVTQHFTIDGIPIHPLFISRFLVGWNENDTDILSITLSNGELAHNVYGYEVVNFAEWDSSVQLDTTSLPSEFIRFNCEQTYGICAKCPLNGFIGYRRLGIMQDDIQIIAFQHQYRDPDHFYSNILFVKPSIRNVFRPENSRRGDEQMLALDLVGIYD